MRTKEKIYPKLMVHDNLNLKLREAGLPSFNIIEYKAVKFFNGYEYDSKGHMDFFDRIEKGMPTDKKLSHFEDWCDEVGYANIENYFDLPVSTLENYFNQDLTWATTNGIEHMPVAFCMCPKGCTTEGYDLIYAEWTFGHSLIFNTVNTANLMENGDWAMQGAISKLRRRVHGLKGSVKDCISKSDIFTGHIFIGKNSRGFFLMAQGPTMVLTDPRFEDYGDDDAYYLPQLTEFLKEEYSWELDSKEKE